MSSEPDTKLLSLSSLLSDQTRLLKQAAKAIPHSFNKCTYDEPGGYIRQAIYLCKTCTGEDGAPGKGICAACSVSCHADHEQLELFPKRAFRCDCPTTSIPVPCTLHQPVLGNSKEPPNEENVYGPNFSGCFCRCGRDYDPLTETETMVQCVACEDWWHESCLNLRGVATHRTPHSSPAKNSCAHRSSSPVGMASSEADYTTDEEGNGEVDMEEDMGDGLSLIPPGRYDSLICGACAFKVPVIKKWAGTRGFRMVIRRHPRQEPATPSKKVDFGGWEVLGDEPEDEPETGRKRSGSPSVSEPASKKLRISEAGASAPRSVVCSAPRPNPTAQQVFKEMQSNPNHELTAENDPLAVEGEGDIFLSDGWRDRWCRCDKCLPDFDAFPYLLVEEETYVPPDDPDSRKSLEELGLRALENLPRDKAIDSIRAFNDMRDNLLAYLRPFAEQGKVVRDEDVAAFFERLKEGKDGPSN